MSEIQSLKDSETKQTSHQKSVKMNFNCCSSCTHITHLMQANGYAINILDYLHYT